jgi:hypothetical protein
MDVLEAQVGAQAGAVVMARQTCKEAAQRGLLQVVGKLDKS